MSTRPYDLVIYGATSFVGQILTRYLLEHIHVGSEVSWAIAGRSERKLNELRNSLGSDAKNLPVIVAHADDEVALSGMVKSARVIATTVGPYALYGEMLVKSCALNGTDYCDLCGEAYWIKKMIVKYGNTAKESGARLVSCCGFDSIPSDLGVHFLQEHSKKQFNAYCTEIKLGVNAMKGGASGGTLASMIEAVKAAKNDVRLRKEMGNPYILCPEKKDLSHRQVSIRRPVFDQDFQSWSGPFIMEAINARVVLRSHMLSGMPYGNNFLYREQMITGKGFSGRLSAFTQSIVLGLFAVSVFMTPTRKLLQRFLPKPGEGPSPEAQAAGYFDISLLGKTGSGKRLEVQVTGDRDPGYGCTAKMLAQSGLSLAFDFDEVDREGGFWTPATLMGDKLITRLIDHAGMTFNLK